MELAHQGEPYLETVNCDNNSWRQLYLLGCGGSDDWPNITKKRDKATEEIGVPLVQRYVILPCCHGPLSGYTGILALSAIGQVAT